MADSGLSRHWSDAQAEAAITRGKEKLRNEPQATSARFDRKSERVVVELTNGATFTFPPRLVEGLHEASPDEIADVEVIGRGFGLHWERLDLDYTVPGIVNGIFGTTKWMAARAGRAKSPAKAAAARANGAKGGRPRKGLAERRRDRRPDSIPARELTTAEKIAEAYGLNPKSYRAALRSADLGWHEKHRPWEVTPASPEQRDMLKIAERMRTEFGD